MPTVLSSCKRYLNPSPLLGDTINTQPLLIQQRIPVGILIVSSGSRENVNGEQKSYPADPVVALVGSSIPP